MVQSVYAIPCDHPAAKDGVFHCVPSYMNVEHMHDKFEFILVDTQKVVSELQRHDPDMLQHARFKFNGSTSTEWLEETSLEHPRDMGMWTYSREFGLNICAGQAAVIELAQQINLPCFPIAVEKSTGWQLLDELRAKVTYTGPFRHTVLRTRVHAQDLDC